MIVYGASFSPFVRKTLAFANEKGIAFEHKPVRPSKEDAELVASSPFGKIPALKDGDFRISDSSAIIAYWDALQPEPALVPHDPKERARVIWFDEFADTIMGPVSGKLFFNRVVSPRFFGKPGDLEAAAKAEAEEIPPVFAYIESQLPASGFLVGDRLTLADISVASFLVNYAHAGVTPDANAYPKTARFKDAMHARESYAPYIAQEKAILGG